MYRLGAERARFYVEPLSMTRRSTTSQNYNSSILLRSLNVLPQYSELASREAEGAMCLALAFGAYATTMY
jgi:hypothetical protein